MSLATEEFLNDPELVFVTSVIGRFPECIEVAAKFNLDTLVTSERTWKFVTLSGDLDTMSRAYWRQIARAKQGIILASNPSLAPSISLYGVDLSVLRGIGYIPDYSGTRLRHKDSNPFSGLRQPLQSSLPKSVKDFLGKLFPGATPTARMQRALTPAGSDRSLEEKAREELRAAFRDPSARVISSQKFPQAFGNAILIISVGSLHLRIVRDRSDFWLDVAPAHAPSRWRPLQLVIGTIQGYPERPLPSCINLRHAGALLESALSPLIEAHLPENFAATKAAIDQSESRILRDWIKGFFT
jgi:hypothetical protein